MPPTLSTEQRKEQRRNALDVQELVDLAICFLDDSPRDLATCSVVARSWVHAAQASLFRAPHITNPLLRVFTHNDGVVLQLYNTLVASPHLIGHVRDLELQQGLSRATIEKISSLPFTRLENLSLNVLKLTYWDPQVKPLLGLHSLRYLRLSTPGLVSCAHLLAGHPSSIRHLHLRCAPWEGDAVSVGFPVFPIRLRSFYLRVHIEQHPDEPQSLDSNTHPFDLTELKAFGVFDARSIRWESIPARTKESLEVLQVGLTDTKEVDLSQFPQLTTVRLMLRKNTISGCRNTLATISPTHRIQTILLWIANWNLIDEKEYAENLDQILSSLVPAPIVKFECIVKSVETEACLRKLFPKLVLQRKFQMVYHAPGIADPGLRVGMVGVDIRMLSSFVVLQAKLVTPE
ncbi:hypothetical protein R3P38DRAFT_3371587 [Favolaschia claudopus]|uniref:F-box domain-containing protein n=1 Tax=Favolaschia claudopus TaxID=2862362 RepID=A0AAV9ZYT6_9AGAR